MERLIGTIMMLLGGMVLQAQTPEQYLRQGNEQYQRGDLPAAVESFGKAENDERGMFNMGNAYYRQEKADEARQAFENAAAMAKTPAAQAKAFHNLGNSWMVQGNFGEAVKAYKEALKRTPADNETRYNLAFAQRMLQQQEQQQQGGNDQEKDQGGQDQPQDGQGEPDEDRDGDKNREDKQQNGDDRKEQPKTGEAERIDPQDAKRMLDAAEQQEKDVQDKVRQMMQPKPKQPAEKDW